MRMTEPPGQQKDTVAWVVLAIIAASLILMFTDDILRCIFGGSP